MNRLWNIIMQLVLSGGQIINLLEPVLKPNHKVYAMIALSIAQIVVSAVAHDYNPDGSSAKVAYVKEGV